MNWVTPEIKSILQQKRNIYELTKDFPGDIEIKSYYSNYCKFVQGVISRTKKDANKKYINQGNNPSQRMWKVISGSMNNPQQKRVKSIVVNGNQVDEEAEIAENFNNYFLNMITDLGLPIPHLYTLNSSSKHSMFLAPTDEIDVYHIIKSLNNSNSCGRPLSYLVNISFTSAIFPDILKQAVMKPIYKAKDPLPMQNYRPITLLSNLSKIIERLMHVRLIKYLFRFDLITRNQNCFLSNQNCDL